MNLLDGFVVVPLEHRADRAVRLPEPLLDARIGRIARVAFDTRLKLNSFGRAAWAALVEVLSTVEQDSDVRVVVLHGTEEAGFSAGANLSELSGRSKRRDFAVNNDATRAVSLLAACPFPTIAAIQGAAVGGGLELALACDVRVAAADAKLGLPELRLGLLPGLGGTQRLGRVVGSGVARYMIFTGAILSGAEAFRVGLVELLADETGPLATALGIARKIAEHDPDAVRIAKSLLSQTLDAGLGAGLLTERFGQGLLMGRREQVDRIEKATSPD